MALVNAEAVEEWMWMWRRISFWSWVVRLDWCVITFCFVLGFIIDRDCVLHYH